MDITLALWLLPVVLLVVTVILLLYLAFLNFAPVRKDTSSSAPRQSRPPTSVQNPVVLAPQPAPQPAPYSSPPPQPVRMAPPPPPMPSAPPQYRPPDSTELETMGKLVIIAGLEPRELPLPSAQFVIGRFYAPENNVLVGIDEKSVSRKHAALRVAAQGREYYIQDVGSSYGTHLIVDGRFDRLAPGREERIYNNDVVQFGSAVQVRFILPCETRSAITQL